MNGEAATQFNTILDQRRQARESLKAAIVEELGSSSVIGQLFSEAARDQVADGLIIQAESLRLQEADEVEAQQAIEDARDKRSVAEIEAEAEDTQDQSA